MVEPIVTPRTMRQGRRSTISTLSSLKKSPYERSRHHPSTAKMTKTAVRRLKKSNNSLERELAAQKQYQSMMEQRFSNLESWMKDRNMRKSIHSLSSFAFLIVVGFLLYCNYLMFSPHLNAIVMAVLFSFVLKDVHTITSAYFVLLQEFLVQFTNTLIVGACVVIPLYLNTAGDDRSAYSLGLTIVMLSICIAFFCCVVHARTMAAGIITIGLVLLFCVPTLYMIRMCVLEIDLVTKYIVELLDSESDALGSLVDTLHASNMYKLIYETVESFGYALPPLNDDMVKEFLESFKEFFSNNLSFLSDSVLSIIFNITDMMWAFTTFLTTFLYLLQAENPWRFISTLSPLPPKDNQEIYASLRTSSTRIFLCSGCMGLFHVTATYISLSTTSIPIKSVLAFLTGIIAMLPIVGTYMIWFPVASFLFYHDQQIQAAIVVGVELFMFIVVDKFLVSKIPGHTYYIGLTVALGLYEFGLFGFILGPLILGITNTVLEIYSKYLQKPYEIDYHDNSPLQMDRSEEEPYVQDFVSSEEKVSMLRKRISFTQEQKEDEDPMDMRPIEQIKT